MRRVPFWRSSLHAKPPGSTPANMWLEKLN